MGNLIVTRKQLKKLEEKLDEKLNKLEEKRRYEAGEYYRALNSIWEHDSCDFEGAAEEWRRYRQKDAEATKYYNDPKTRGRDQVRYYKDKFVPDRLFPVGDQSMAHLIPNDPSCSLGWLRALSIVTGVDINPESESPLFDEKLRALVEGKAPEGGVASTDVPLKAWNWNFLMLPEEHKKHFDKLARSNEEKMIACPIWDPKDEWKPGTGYKLMIAASPKTYQWLLGKHMLTEDSKQYKWLGEALPGEPQKATDFLALTVRALADLLIRHGEGDLERLIDKYEKKKGTGEEEEDTRLDRVFKAIEGAIPRDLLSQRSFHSSSSAGNSNEKSKRYKINAQEFITKVKKVDNVRKKGLVSGNKRHVQIPYFDDELSKEPMLVVDLGVYFKGKERLIPDPFLVVLKAAVSWSDFLDQKLLPACRNHSDRPQDARNEDLIPAEIFAIAGEDAAQGDDDSVISLSENLTGPPGDGNFEAMSTVSPSGKTSVRRVVAA